MNDAAPLNLASILQCHAAGRPNETAIAFGRERISYLELWRRVERTAASLHERGVKAGDRVGLALREHPDHLLLHYALARLGAIILPLDHRWTEAEKTTAATAFKARLIVTEQDQAPLPGLEALALSDDWLQANRAPLPPAPQAAALPLLISLSSGTTGKPKGALVSHEQMHQRFISQWVSLGFNAQDRFLGLTPLFFGAGRSFAMSFLAAGAVVILDPPPHGPQELAAAVNDSGATATFLVPTQLRELLPLHKQGLLFPGLDKLVVSGAALHPAEAQEVRRKLSPNLMGYYASSEGGGVSVLTAGEYEDWAHTAGRAAYRVEAQVVDEQGVPVAPGETGRLRYRGPGVATRFLDSAGRETAGDPAGWFYPGDLATRLERGHIVLRGRDKDLINRGGVNIYPAEIEAVLAQLAAVREVAVVGAPCEKLGESVVAFIVADEPLSPAGLDEHCRKQLASYKVPSRYIPIDELPRARSGKPDKQALLARLG